MLDVTMLVLYTTLLPGKHTTAVCVHADPTSTAATLFFINWWGG
jgi:hypothetical protein